MVGTSAWLRLELRLGLGLGVRLESGLLPG